MSKEENMNVVFVGHVDHGKSTIIGRLLADTRSLPEGRLKQIKEKCQKESKAFEYAFLLDALKDEQSQGITIDSARCFFKTKKRNYIIIDAPGHIEFLKNMISGAARAEAALLVIDAKEGVQENSKRHGYMMSMLGIKQLVVCVNKMDLVNYDQKVFKKIKDEYETFLKKIEIKPMDFIPVSGTNGDLIVDKSKNMKWYNGKSVLEALDSFKSKELIENKELRVPIQDVYKFTKENDDRRIIAGKIESGSLKVGDEVVFLPSGKRSKINSIESFNTEKKISEIAGHAVGITLKEQIFVNRGDVLCKASESHAMVSSIFRCKIFWLGKKAMMVNQEYILKLGTVKVPVKIKSIKNVINASNLKKSKRVIVERHDIVDCILECLYPIAFDLINQNEALGRFVIVDKYTISGGGIITERIDDKYIEVRNQVYLREKKWYHGSISPKVRSKRYNQLPKFLLLTGKSGIDKINIAKSLEKVLFEQDKKVYFLGIGNLLRGLDADIDKKKRKEHIRRLGEVAHIMMDAGMVVIGTASDLNDDEFKLLQTIISKDDVLIINIGNDDIVDGLIDLNLDVNLSLTQKVDKILDLLEFKNVFFVNGE